MTDENKNFWSYFIKKFPQAVTYSNSVYDYYVKNYLGQKLKIQSLKKKISDPIVAFSLKYSDKYFDEVKNKLETIGIKAIKIENPFEEFNAKFLVCDNQADRFIALVQGIPVVMINMLSFALDKRLNIRSDDTPMLYIPKKIVNRETNKVLILSRMLMSEMRKPNEDDRLKYYAAANNYPVENSAEEIFDAIDEMNKKIDGTLKYTDEEKYFMQSCSRIKEYFTGAIMHFHNIKGLIASDFYEVDVSAKFLKNNESFLGPIYSLREKFLMKNFLPKSKGNLKLKSESKIKVRVDFVAWNFWNCLRTFCEACLYDKDIDLLITASSPRDVERLKSYNYKTILVTDYNVKIDKPDVLVL